MLQGEIAFLTHYWYDNRFPQYHAVTKVGCADISKLEAWCIQKKLDIQYIHRRDQYPHFDLIGPYQVEILLQLGLEEHIERFNLRKMGRLDSCMEWWC